MTSFIIAKTFFYGLHNREGLVSGHVKQAKLDTTQGVEIITGRVIGLLLGWVSFYPQQLASAHRSPVLIGNH